MHRRVLIFAFAFYFFGIVNDADAGSAVAPGRGHLERADVSRRRGRAAGRATSSCAVGDTAEPTGERLADDFTDHGARTGPVPIDVTVDRDGHDVTASP